jgi:hypothetical protein
MLKAGVMFSPLLAKNKAKATHDFREPIKNKLLAF